MRKPRKETFFNRCRHWLNPPPRHLSLLARMYMKGAKVSPVQSDLEDTGKVGAWEKFMERMVAAVAKGDQTYVSLLVLNYWGFFSIQQVLDWVSNRYANSCNLPDRDGGGQECLKNTFSCLLLTWLQEFPDDFCEPPDFSSLKELLSFAQVALPGSVLERQAQDLLSWLESLVASETQTEGEEHGGGDGWEVWEEMKVGPKSIFAFGQGVKRGISPFP
ncbi:ral guanine nucleotide dissociation stimulator-like [Tamandua tetradactyla]|uniref:ral guanine nucleotide dissociation stimulator-like n=1 Tax=Tamandua tetradactyla TaxID=48850 RepID=UPI004053D901